MQNAEARKIVEKAEKALLNVRISEVVKKGKILKYRENKAIEELKNKVPNGTVETLKKINEGRQKAECEKSSERQKKKFQNLKERKERGDERRSTNRKTGSRKAERKEEENVRRTTENERESREANNNEVNEVTVERMRTDVTEERENV